MENQTIINITKEKQNYDAILAIGGGAVIDLAKAIKYHKQDLYFICLPTTVATGSENTSFYTYYVQEKKHSQVGQHLIPDTTLYHHKLYHHFSEQELEQQSMDCITQSIESLYSKKRNNKSISTAIESISLWSKDHLQLKDYIQAASLSGTAINIANTNLCHALSYQLTYRYSIPHHQAVFFFLPCYLEFIQRLGHQITLSPQVITKIDRLHQRLHIPIDSIDWNWILTEGIKHQRASNFCYYEPKRIHDYFYSWLMNF